MATAAPHATERLKSVGQFVPSRYQQAIFDALEADCGDIQVQAVAGSGKCLGAGTPVMLFDGNVIPVELVEEGDLLMGPDSNPRRVLSVTAGHGPLVRIVPVKGEPWVCNDVHILTLKGTNRFKGQIIDISVKDYLRRCEEEKSFSDQWKLFRVSVDFPLTLDWPVDPYLVGLWIGDGSTFDVSFSTVDEEIVSYLKDIASRYGGEAVIREDPTCLHVRIRRGPRGHEGCNKPFKLRRDMLCVFRDDHGNKSIPVEYLTATRPMRLALLAGLIDTDGHLSNSNMEFSTRHEHLADQVAFLCRSLGFAAYKKVKIVNSKPYWRLSISGDLSQIPCRLPRKQATHRCQIKNVLVTGFAVEPFGDGDYYGFTLDGDGRFLLGDFTVTHNTTTLEQALNRLPASALSDTLFCAFNKEIVAELSRRVPRGVVVKTIHAIGLATISSAINAKASCRPNDGWINGNKYRLMLKTYWQEKAGNHPPAEIASAIFCLVHFCRVTLTDFTDQDALEALVRDYEIEIPKGYLSLIVGEIVPTLLTWGSQGRSKADPDGIVRDLSRPTWAPHEMIDYDDMLWLPHVMDWRPKQFGYVAVDECQDLSAAQLELVLNCRREGGRMLFVGDPRQAIYNFCGADSNSYQKIAERTGALQLPLSVSYRCARAVIEKAQSIVPEIEASPDAPMGVVESIKQESFIGMVQPNDMVLCRVNAPLISMAFQLLAEGKRAKVKGRDIGAQMIKLLDTIASRPGFRFDSFHDSLSGWLQGELAALDPRKDNEMRTASLHDRAESLSALYGAAVGRGARSMQDLRAEVQALFVDDGTGFVMLSSIHRSKGLEANRVFILKPELMPHPLAKGERQVEQEHNLTYVAYTRAKHELYTVITPRQ